MLSRELQYTCFVGGHERYHSRDVTGAPAYRSSERSRRYVSPPSLPNVSKNRPTALWLLATHMPYPGHHPSKNAHVHTPGSPAALSVVMSLFASTCHCPMMIGSLVTLYGPVPVETYNNGTDSCRSCMTNGCQS